LSVKRGDLLKYLKANGFYLLRGCGKAPGIPSINGIKTILVKRHRSFDRITLTNSASKLV
jgi:hypothetical protein